MHSQLQAFAVFACAGFGRHIGFTLLTLATLSAGGVLLYLSRAGKIKSVNCMGAHLKGESAKLCSTIFAVFFLFVGALCLVSLLLQLDC